MDTNNLIEKLNSSFSSVNNNIQEISYTTQQIFDLINQNTNISEKLKCEENKIIQFKNRCKEILDQWNTKRMSQLNILTLMEIAFTGCENSDSEIQLYNRKINDLVVADKKRKLLYETEKEVLLLKEKNLVDLIELVNTKKTDSLNNIKEICCKTKNRYTNDDVINNYNELLENKKCELVNYEKEIEELRKIITNSLVICDKLTSSQNENDLSNYSSTITANEKRVKEKVEELKDLKQKLDVTDISDLNKEIDEKTHCCDVTKGLLNDLKKRIDNEKNEIENNHIIINYLNINKENKEKYMSLCFRNEELNEEFHHVTNKIHSIQEKCNNEEIMNENFIDIDNKLNEQYQLKQLNLLELQKSIEDKNSNFELIKNQLSTLIEQYKIKSDVTDYESMNLCDNVNFLKMEILKVKEMCHLTKLDIQTLQFNSGKFEEQLAELNILENNMNQLLMKRQCVIESSDKVEELKRVETLRRELLIKLECLNEEIRIKLTKQENLYFLERKISIACETLQKFIEFNFDYSDFSKKIDGNTEDYIFLKKEALNLQYDDKVIKMECDEDLDDESVINLENTAVNPSQSTKISSNSSEADGNWYTKRYSIKPLIIDLTEEV